MPEKHNGERGGGLTPEQVSPNAKYIRSPGLLEAIRESGIDSSHNKTLTDALTRQICDAVFEAQRRQFDSVARNRYHNAEHAEEVLSRVNEILKYDGSVSPGTKQVIRIAAAFHDFGHCGTTLRRAPDGFSNEELAANLADEWIVANQVPFSVHQRVMLYSLIVGTTFGDSRIKPETKAEQILAIADIGGFTKSWRDWVIQNAQLLSEMPRSRRPKSLTEWLEGNEAFLEIVRTRLDALPKVKHLWEKKLVEKQQIIRTLLAGQGSAADRAKLDRIIPLLNTK